MLPTLALLLATTACDRDPVALNTAQPVLPKTFHAAGGNRSATVAVTLDASGRVTAASIYKTSGNSLMDAAALDAAKRSTFAPGESDCKPVGGTFAMDFSFEGYGLPQTASECPRDARVIAVVIPGSPDYSPGLGEVRVVISVTIGPDGNVLDARVAESSGNLYLDRAAVDAARNSKYSPKLVAVRRQAQAGGSSSVTCEPATGTYRFVTTFRPN